MDKDTYFAARGNRHGRAVRDATADAIRANFDRDQKTRAAVARGNTNIQAAADCLRAAADEFELAAANSEGDLRDAYSANAAAIRAGIHELSELLY